MDSVNPDPSNIPNDDLQLQNYQDDLDTSSRIHDPIMDEESDDPTEELGVDKREYKRELDKYAVDEPDRGDIDEDENYEGEYDDRLNEIQDLDDQNEEDTSSSN